MRLSRSLLAAAIAASLAPGFAAAQLAIPDMPLQAGATVAPNIWFILDDSGSMSSTSMPSDDDRMQINTADTDIDGNTYVTNVIFYNPNTTYLPWRNADGSRMGNTPYSAAYDSSDLASGTTISLLDEHRTFYVPKDGITDFSQTENYWRYQLRKDGTLQRCERTYTTSWGWRNCAALSSVTWPGGVTRTVAQEQANYANWYSYHRTRTKVAKAGASEAFSTLPPTVRVGYTSIWGNGTYDIPVGTNNGEFSGTNKSTWFERMQAASTDNGTPLRSALASARSYFSDTSSTGPWGPGAVSSQLACRQSFAILTTDGFWNSDDGWSTGNVDNTSGSTITGPNGQSYRYNPATPYSDSASGTLADEAMLNWGTDLHATLDNRVPSSKDDPAFWQHLVTFGVSIGLQGSLAPNDTTLAAITAGTQSWPDPTDTEDLHRIDDLWHAAVNGRGEFIAAKDSAAFEQGLASTLQTIATRTLSGSNVAATSTSIGSNTQLFQASYISGSWTGELKAFPVTTGGVSTTANWAASSLIPASRNLFTWTGSAGTSFPTSAQQTTLGVDETAYIRGSAAKELRNGGTFRNRSTVLGDIAHSTPAYDSNTNTVFVGSNGGMLHAFDASTGIERFGYVPAGLNFTQLKTLASTNYAHKFFVDGPVVISPRRITPSASTLVGALGRGGRGVFALNVTTPTAFANSNVLWDKTGSAASTNMGLVIGRPVIAKMNNGDNAVIVANGVNSANHRAALVIYNLTTGAELANIDTGDGSTSSPNGLMTVRAWDSDSDGDVDVIYGGDLRGNLWRFDVSGNAASWSNSGNRRILFTATDSSGNRQPITGSPTIGLHPTTYATWVFFGTGRFLTDTDKSDKSVQSWYGIIDNGTSAISGRSALTQRQIAVAGTIAGKPVRGFEPYSPLPTTSKGWVVDFKTPPSPGTAEGERMVGDNSLLGGVLLGSSIIPPADACDVGGRGFINAIDAFTGTTVPEGFFDVNGNGQFNDDLVGSGSSQVTAGSVDLGIAMPSGPAVAGDGNTGLVISGGSAGTTGSVNANLSVIQGRQAWREVMKD